MTFNGSWGYHAAPASDWHSAREVIEHAAHGHRRRGQPAAEHRPGARRLGARGRPNQRLVPVGQWLAQNGEAVYGKVDRAYDSLDWIVHGSWTLKGKTAYYWTGRWVGSEIVIGGLQTKVRSISSLDTGGEVAFSQTKDRLVMRGLPERSPDRIAGVAVLKIEFAAPPRQVLGTGCVVL